MENLFLFIDGSVDRQSQVGYGASLSVFEDDILRDDLVSWVKVKKFEKTSSTKLELQTLLWALGDGQISGQKVVVYTDSQNIMRLPQRRLRLEQNDFRSKQKKLLNHAALYHAFFNITDVLRCDFVKVRGHQASKYKDDMGRLFSLVDQASRKALRTGL